MARYGKKRKVERIRIGLPVRARINNQDAVVLDLSFMGCRVEHTSALRVGAKVKLQILWEGRPLEFDCHVVRCSVDTRAARNDRQPHYQSGMLFTDESTPATTALRDIIVRQVIDALEEQKANAHGEIPIWLRPDAASVYGETAPYTSLPYLRVARERGYVAYVLQNGGWLKKRTRSIEQPEEGFTVWAYEDEDQLEKLTRIYEDASDEVRSLIRICAQLSLVIDDSIPPQRFEP